MQKCSSVSDIGDQAVVRQVLETRQPLMSELFPLVQGGTAVVIEYPVFGSDGRFTGVVSTAFSPYDLVAPIAENATAGTAYSFMVAQPDGRALYDPEPQEVGKETFNETLYAEFPGIPGFARQYEWNSSGYATYSFYDTGCWKRGESGSVLDHGGAAWHRMEDHRDRRGVKENQG